MKLNMASLAEEATLQDKAHVWLKSTNGMFGSVQSTVVFAITEYLANQQGLTIYSNRVGEDYEPNQA